MGYYFSRLSSSSTSWRMVASFVVTLLVLILLATGSVEARYLPTFRPVSYCSTTVEQQNSGTDEACKSTIDVFVNRLDSFESALPYEYDRYDFCQVDEELLPSENLGQVVSGDRIRPSPYRFTFNENKGCVKVCTRTYQTTGDNKESQAKLNLLKKAVLFNYQHHWIIDNMPVSWCYEVQTEQADPSAPSIYCSPGFPVGCFVDAVGQRKDACVIDQRYGERNSYYIFNHVNIDIEFHPVTKDGTMDESVARLVRARIIPYSINQTMEGDDIKSCHPDNYAYNGLSIPGGNLEQSGLKEISITYSYNVSFSKNTSVYWASRWDYVLDAMPHTRIHWFSITNSLVVVMFLTGMVAIILTRTLHGGIVMGKKMETRWIHIQEDVFRPPRNELLLSVFLGSGSQIIIVTFILLLLSCIGIFSPANRGLFMTTALIMFPCMGIVAGYVSSKVYKNLGGKDMRLNVLLTSLLIPGVVFFEFLSTNFVFWGHGSSAAVPLETMLILTGLWFVVYIPCVFIGSYYGFRRNPVKSPCPIGEIRRTIPKSKFHDTAIPSVIIGGILPFGCIFIQSFFILNSIWYHEVYYMYGFLTLVALILMVTCAEVATIICYFQLNAENYHWWWRSFLSSGFTAFYFIVYCTYYYWTRLELHGAASAFIFFSYTFVMSLLLFLFCGTVAFFSCLWFVMKIYSTIENV